MNGIHCFGTGVIRTSTTADTFKAALYQATGSLGASTTVYTTTAEVGVIYGAINYPAGGIVVTNANPPSLSGTTAVWTPSTNLVFAFVTIPDPFDTVLIYNASQGNAAVGVWTFGSQTINAGVVILTMPSIGLLALN
jgi:hypothetical protein